MAYSFASASSQSLSVADTAVLDITGALTLHAALKAATTQNNNGVLTKYAATNNQRSYAIWCDTNKGAGFVSPDGSFSTDSYVVSSTTLDTTQNYLTFVFTPSASVQIFINGASDGVKTTSITASVYSGTAELRIGCYGGGGQFFNGVISECAIWSAALTADEVASLGKGFRPQRVRPQSLVFYAPLIRNLMDRRGGLTITNNNSATVADHPRVY